MFNIKNVKFKSILDIDNLTIDSGKVTCIVGESGSGKTTLIKLLNAMNSPDSGTITYNGKDINEIDAVHLRSLVIMLPQNPDIYPGTIRDNLNIGAHFQGKPNFTDIEMINVLQLLKLDKDLDSSPVNLSGGEKQRLCIARVLLLRPEVLLLDEPTAALDQGTEDIVVEEVIKFVKSYGGNVIIITHSKNLAERFSDVIITINKGKIDSIREEL